MKQKIDLNLPPTKRDLQRFATKAELRNIKSALWNQSLRIEEKVEKLKNTEKRITKIESTIKNN